jgi:hypothetical protein
MSFPEELLKSEFLRHAEVNIALEIGENVIHSKNYAFMIESILSKPKFILFLRNTTRFDYYKLDSSRLHKQQSIELNEKDNLIDITHNDIHVATFSKNSFLMLKLTMMNFEKQDLLLRSLRRKKVFLNLKMNMGKLKAFLRS